MLLKRDFVKGNCGCAAPDTASGSYDLSGQYLFAIFQMRRGLQWWKWGYAVSGPGSGGAAGPANHFP
jgi:hypothetical protein